MSHGLPSSLCPPSVEEEDECSVPITDVVEPPLSCSHLLLLLLHQHDEGRRRMSVSRPVASPTRSVAGGVRSDELQQEVLHGVQVLAGLPQGSVRVQLGSQEEQLPVLVDGAQRQGFMELWYADSIRFILSTRWLKSVCCKQIPPSTSALPAA